MATPLGKKNNAAMEAMARDYSELHIDIMASVANENSPQHNGAEQSPATFQSLTTPNREKKKSGKSRFSLRRFFRRKTDQTTQSSPTKNSETSGDS